MRKAGRRTTTSDLAGIAYDADLFEAFYREHVETVQRFIARRVQDPHRAADLTADVFLAVIDSAHTYRPDRGGPVAWLHGIARNVVAADHRRGAKELRANGRIRSGRSMVDAGDLERLLGRIAAEAHARTLYAALERLSEGERAVLELVALDGLSVREAATALGIGHVAARVRLHRARRALQSRLGSSFLEITERGLETT